jgi:cell division protein FtsI (penicillin-binding protein 3)
MRIEPRHIKRQKAISLIVFCLAGGLILRLASLQVWAVEDYAEKARRQHQKRTILQSSRGRILDRNGKVLATNLESRSFFANNVAEIDNLRAIAIRFSEGSESRSRVLARLKKNPSFVWLARQVTEGVSEEKLPEGVGWMVEMRRSYPMKSLAGQVLGYTDIDNVGIEGMELAKDDLLKGEPGVMASQVDAKGKCLAALGTVEKLPENGADMALTIDADYQSILEEELALAVAKFKAESGIAIVTDPRTGEVLAMANVPLYDPNAFSKVEPEVRRNRAVTDLFEPGSTFKLVALAGALEEGLFRPEDRIFCENGSLNVAGDEIRDTHPNGWLTVGEVIEQSSNIGTIKIGRALGPGRLFRYLRLFGFGSNTCSGFPGEVAGELKHPSKWSKRSLETISIGQEIGVTALQMVAAYGAIANGGQLMSPRIVKRAIHDDGAVSDMEAMAIRQVVSPAAARRVTEVLEGVVRNGTGSNAQIPGYRVAGKTGTAQRAAKGKPGYDPNRYVSSFVGFLPADQPELLCLVVVDSPQETYWGSQVAAPVFNRVMRRVLSLRDTRLRHHSNPPDVAPRSEAAAPVLAGISGDRAARILERQGLRAQFSEDVSGGVHVRSVTGKAAQSPGMVSDKDVDDLDGLRRVPSVTGTTLRQAVSKLTAAGFRVQATGSGWVTRQVPASGGSLNKGALCRVICERES